jgi:nucleotide-binding universal stress UspA family protein
MTRTRRGSEESTMPGEASTDGAGTNGAGAGQVVVVGVDGSAQSIAALRWAAKYGAATGATIRAVRVWHYPSAATPTPEGKAPPAVTEEVRQEMQEQLDDAIGQVYPDGLPDNVQTRIAYGHSAATLIDESREADLLVLGNKGYSALTGVLIGSVSLHCVTHAVCPVTVVRTTGHAARAAR